MQRLLRWAIFAFLAAIAVAAVGGIAVAAGTYREEAKASKPISNREAIADAMKQLPNNGAAYTVVAVELEPTSKHFEYSGANGRFGGDLAQECLRIPPLPPLPFLSPCRYYPVWVVDLTSQSCDVTIAINALSGRFAGAGTGYRGVLPISGSVENCLIRPGSASETWWEPVWG